MEETNDVPVMVTQEGEFVDDGVSTLEIPTIENPDEREYENVEIEKDGGL